MMYDVMGRIRFLYLVFLALLVWSFMVYLGIQGVKEDITKLEQRMDQMELNMKILDQFGQDRT